ESVTTARDLAQRTGTIPTYFFGGWLHGRRTATGRRAAKRRARARQLGRERLAHQFAAHGRFLVGAIVFARVAAQQHALARRLGSAADSLEPFWRTRLAYSRPAEEGMAVQLSECVCSPCAVASGIRGLRRCHGP